MIRKVLKYFSAICLFVSLVLILYGINGPFYKTEPLKSSFTFAAIEPKRYKFEVIKSDKYMVEIHLKNVLSDEEMNTILGNFLKKGEGGKANVEWYLHEGDKLVAKGSNRKYGYSPILGRDYSGLAIGEISVQKGKSYFLSLHFEGVNPDWDVTKPYIEVGLHPAKLEYLVVYFICGILLLAISGPTVCYFIYKEIKKRSH